MNKKTRQKKRKKRSQGVWTGDARWKRETDGARGRDGGESSKEKSRCRHSLEAYLSVPSG